MAPWAKANKHSDPNLIGGTTWKERTESLKMSDSPYSGKPILRLLGEACSPVVEHFPSMLMFLSSISSTTKTKSNASNKRQPSPVVQSYNLLLLRQKDLKFKTNLNITMTLSHNKK